MPSDRADNGDPRSRIPELAGRLEAPRPDEQRASLANRLVPVVDKIRTLASNLGVRPYRVFLMHVAWSGGEVGDGNARVVGRVEILPPPRVRSIGSMDEVVRSTGVTEEGAIEIDRISARFTEDDLLGRTLDLQDPNARRTTEDGMDFYWELQETRPSTPLQVVRRFAVQGVPELRRGACEWVVRLTKQDFDPGRQGGLARDDV